MDVQQYLDQRNTPLWNEVSVHFEIDFDTSSDDKYAVYTKGNKARIYLPTSPPSKAGFTHELLHLLLDKKEINVTGTLIMQFRDNVFEDIVQADLAEHIGNCLNHVKMLPLYLELGFDRQEFISDYDTHKFDDMDRSIIGSLFKIPGKVWGIAVNQYLAKYFAIKACPNDKFDYSSDLRFLQDTDAQLYEILSRFWDAWQNFQIDVDDPVYNNYNLTCYDFIVELKDWVIQKKKEGF